MSKVSEKTDPTEGDRAALTSVVAAARCGATVAELIREWIRAGVDADRATTIYVIEEALKSPLVDRNSVAENVAESAFEYERRFQERYNSSRHYQKTVGRPLRPRNIFEWQEYFSGTQRRRGRPPKNIAQGPARSLGRPRKDEFHKATVLAIRAEIKRSGLAGHGHIKQAIRNVIQKYCEFDGRTALLTTLTMRRVIPKIEKIYSAMKRQFPEE